MASPPDNSPQSSILEGVPLSFFVSLIREIAEHATVRNKRHNSNWNDYPALQIFRRWVNTLKSRFSPLPAGTTRVVFRLLFPEMERRRVYDMQETTLARNLGQIFGQGKEDSRLASWHDESSQRHGKPGCLGLEVQQITDQIQSESPSLESPINLTDVDALLDELAALSGYTHKDIRCRFPKLTRRTRLQILQALYRRLSPPDTAVVTQIILKDLRPSLYPLPEEHMHFSAALKHGKSNDVRMLTLEDALRAWDPAGLMNRGWHLMGLEGAVAAFDLEEIPSLKVGHPIQIPKAKKGQSCADALRYLAGAKSAWAETKYDGERCQIHVQMEDDGKAHLTIFSKSQRDSTDDRHGVLDIVQRALSLDGEPASQRIKDNIVLEAEMIPMHGATIDEFWRLRRLISNTAYGARGTRARKRLRRSDSQETISSMDSDADDREARHPALVFFDVLMLDSKSLISETYSSRRSVLESVITPIDSEAILADRWHIDLRRGADFATAQLQRIFADSIAASREGLVLKASEAAYNSRPWPWVKLKKDYIPGHGDALDLVVVGASWEKDRARTLRVSSDTLTTFYLGSLSNQTSLDRDPSGRAHFHVYFTVSYGLDRDQLEEFNFLIKSSDPCPFQASTQNLQYDYTLFGGIPSPRVMLGKPLLVEVFGAGFTKAEGGEYYELRFPRLTKFYRPAERSWRDCVTASELHQIGRKACGRDRRNKDIDDSVSALFGKPASPSVKDLRRRETESLGWEMRLGRLRDGVPAKTRRPRSDEEVLYFPSTPFRPLVANSVQLSIRTAMEAATASPASPPSLQAGLPLTPRSLKRSRGHTGADDTENIGLWKRKPSQASVKGQAHSQTDRGRSATSPLQELNIIVSAPSPPTALWDNCVAWVSSTTIQNGIPRFCQVSTLDALLDGCGWVSQKSPSPQWLRYGIVLVDIQAEEGATALASILETIRGRRLCKDLNTARKPVLVLDHQYFEVDLPQDLPAIEQHAMCCMR